MAGEKGLEPSTFAVTGRRCNQLNYSPAKRIISEFEKVNSYKQSCQPTIVKAIYPEKIRLFASLSPQMGPLHHPLGLGKKLVQGHPRLGIILSPEHLGG